MRINIPLLLAMALTLTLPACTQPEQKAAGPRQVLLAEATAASDVQTTSYPGRTRAGETSSLAFRVSGTLQSLAVKEGDHVRRGQVVARLDDRDYRTQLAATEAEYAQVEGEAGRVMAMYADSATSQNNYDKARYGLKQIEQKLAHHRDQVADCVLRAPFDGYVQSVLHEAHETVGAGMPVVRLFAASGVEIVINIPASEYQRRDAFDTFAATFASLPGREFALRLINVARRANANQLYEVRLAIDDARQLVTPGMATTVTLRYKADLRQPVVVPASAVFTDARGTAVYVYDDGGEAADAAASGAACGTLRRVPVTVGFLHSDGSAELTEGLRAGQRVVTSGVHSLGDGERVRPFPQPAASNVGGLL